MALSFSLCLLHSATLKYVRGRHIKYASVFFYYDSNEGDEIKQGEKGRMEIELFVLLFTDC